MARTAVVAGTATAVHGAVSGNKQDKQSAADQQAAANQAAFESQAQLAEMQRQQAAAAAAPVAAAPAAAAPAAGGDDMMAKLSQLADLKAAGILTDEEFAAAKAKILS
jgi:hypothetical protein